MDICGALATLYARSGLKWREMSFGAILSIMNTTKMQFNSRWGTIFRCPAACCGVIHCCNYLLRKYSIFEVPLGRLARDILTVILLIVILVHTYFRESLEIALTFNLLFGVWVVNVVNSGSFVSESDSGSFIPSYPGNQLNKTV